MKVVETREPTIQKEEILEASELEGDELAIETQELVTETQDVETQDQPLHRENDGKERIHEPLEIIELDTNDEKAQEVAGDISLLKYESNKWKYQGPMCEEGMIPLPLHKNTRRNWPSKGFVGKNYKKN